VLAGRHIVLGVTGGVSAYKSAYLARRLVEAGAEVRTIMTESAAEFIGPQTLAAVTGATPLRGFFDQDDESPHTSLASWADAIVVAPATAAALARIASGMSSDVLTATIMAATCPILVAPAMHTEMWEHAATQRNIEQLVADGAVIVGPVTGPLAGGDEGPGRLVEPEEIVAAVDASLTGGLEGWSVLVSAGGTREAIDPVRYIGNHSSGKMGNAIAVSAARRGARVILVTAAVAPDVAGIDVVSVETAAEMAEAVWKHAGAVDVAVLAAAVADFRPVTRKASKLKRADGLPDIDLEATPDILAGVVGMEPRPFVVGFAAESGSLDDAVAKAERRGVDLLVGNDVAKEGSGFGTDTNEVLIVTPDGEREAWPLLTKAEVADRLWDRIVDARSRR
jgi:phosphopantothenoylcysteine decarboxylase/phosphopantothenate--cysteine ligase